MYAIIFFKISIKNIKMTLYIPQPEHIIIKGELWHRIQNLYL